MLYPLSYGGGSIGQDIAVKQWSQFDGVKFANTWYTGRWRATIRVGILRVPKSKGVDMWRRSFLWRLLPLHLLPALVAARPQSTSRKGKILIKSAWGSADPTQATFPFHHANAFAEAGHPVQIFLLGEAVTLMRSVVANSVVPVGWPPLAEGLAKVVKNKIPIHV